MNDLPEQTGAIAREEGAFRDDRIFHIGCDDRYAPDQYFGFFKLPRVRILVYPAVDNLSHAKYVLEKLRAVEVEDDDERWMVLDTDHCIEDGHFESYEKALSEARQLRIRIAISRPSFEVWLALHYSDFADMDGLATADDFGKHLKQVMGGYDKTQLRMEDFPIQRVPLAYVRAKCRDAEVAGGDKPEATTTRVYKIWESILSKTLFSQLSGELLELARQIKDEMDVSGISE